MGLNIEEIIKQVQHAEHSVDVYLDNSNAVRVVDLTAQIAREKGQEVVDRGLTETSPKVALEAELEAIRQNSITVTFRALSKSDISAVRSKVVRDNPIPSSADDDTRAMHEEERDAKLQVELLSLATVKVVNHLSGEESNSLSTRDYLKLYGALSSAQWESLISGYLIAQEAGSVAADLLSDPAFRGDASA